MTSNQSTSRQWWFPIAALTVAGVVLRSAWAITRPSNYSGEAQSVARAFADGRGLADPYSAGSGPSAHLMPTTPVLAGSLYQLLGVGTVAEVILQLLASVEVFTAYALLAVCFHMLAVARRVILATFGFLALVPVFMGPETLDYRYWDGALASLLLALAVLAAVHPRRPTLLVSVGVGLLIAVACFVSPPVGIAAIFMIAARCAIDRNWRAAVLVAASFIAFATAIFTPWMMRNERVLGSPILLRSNLGLELAIGYSAAAARDDSKLAFDQRLDEIHPTISRAAQARYTAMGEVAYFNALKVETLAWIADHPTESVRLSLRHVRQMIAPMAWEFEIGSGFGSGIRSVIHSVLGIGGLLGALGMAIWVDRRFLYPLIAVVTIVLCYFPFQPVARYLYLNYALLAYCTSAALWFVLDRAKMRLRRLRTKPLATTPG